MANVTSPFDLTTPRHLWHYEEEERNNRRDGLAIDVAGYCMLSLNPAQAWKEFQSRVEARIQIATMHHHGNTSYRPPIDDLGHTMGPPKDDNQIKERILMQSTRLDQATKGSSSLKRE